MSQLLIFLRLNLEAQINYPMKINFTNISFEDFENIEDRDIYGTTLKFKRYLDFDRYL